MKRKNETALLAALLGVAFTTQLHGDLLNPTNFTSLGTFERHQRQLRLAEFHKCGGIFSQLGAGFHQPV